MKSLKRLITALLAIAMILTSAGIVAFAEGSFSDIEDPKVDAAVSKLVAYGIITGYDDDKDGVAESFKPGNQITRAEFAAIVTRMKGVANNLPQDSVTGFSDLDNDSSRAWARPYVKAAVDLGIINGFPDGTFRAAEPVTYEQAVKMLICAIGYEIIAQSEYNKAIAINPNASWSAGYIAAAVKHGITKNAYTTQITEPANRGVVAILTSNAVDAPELKEDDKGNLVKPGDDEEEESNMKSITGIITDTFYTGLDTDDTGLSENEIIIDAAKNDDDGKYELSSSVMESIELDKYIGRKVTAYYDKLEGEVTSLRLEKMTSTVIREEHVVSVDGTQIKTRNDNDKTDSESISGATFIVNGKYVENYDFSDFENGTIEIFNAAGKKIVAVTSYDVFVVNSFDRNNEKIFIKYANYEGNNYYQFPTRNSDKPKIYVKSSGNSYKLTNYDSLSLSQFDVVNYLESPAGSAGEPVRKMYVTKGSKSGKVTSGLGEGRKVELNDTIMYLTQQYDAFEGNTNDKKAPFELSDSYTYYVDYNGQIAAVNYNSSSSSGSWAYGYLVEVDTKNNQVGIVDTSGNYKIYTFKDTIRVDGEKMKPSPAFDILKDAAEEIDSNANDNTLEETTSYAQPLKYSVSGGKIEALDTIFGDYSALVNGNDFTYDGKLGADPTSTTTTKVTADGVSYSVNSSTFVLYVPKDRYDTDSYAKMSASTAFSVSKNRYVEVYAVDTTSTNKLAKMVIVYGTNPTLNFTGGSPYLIVTEKGGKGDNNQITGYKNGTETETSVVVSAEKFVTDIGNNANLVTFDDIETGDIIRYITDNKSEAVAIELLYDSSEDKMYTTEMNGNTPESVETQYIKDDETSSKLVAIFGTVISKDTTDSRIEVEADKARSQKYGTNTKVYKLTSAGEVETSSIDEVYDGTDGMDASKIIVFVKSTSTDVAAQTIYIIE